MGTELIYCAFNIFETVKKHLLLNLTEENLFRINLQVPHIDGLRDTQQALRLNKDHFNVCQFHVQILPVIIISFKRLNVVYLKRNLHSFFRLHGFKLV
jgi:hypothetical protein